MDRRTALLVHYHIRSRMTWILFRTNTGQWINYWQKVAIIGESENRRSISHKEGNLFKEPRINIPPSVPMCHPTITQHKNNTDIRSPPCTNITEASPNLIQFPAPPCDGPSQILCHSNIVALLHKRRRRRRRMSKDIRAELSNGHDRAQKPH